MSYYQSKSLLGWSNRILAALKAYTTGPGLYTLHPAQSVKYSTFHGWLAPVPPYPQTWLAQINTAPRSTSQPITHSKQIKYEGLRWHFRAAPAASARCGGSLDSSIEPCGMCEEAHHSIVHRWLFWEWAEHISREDE